MIKLPVISVLTNAKEEALLLILFLPSTQDTISFSKTANEYNQIPVKLSKEYDFSQTIFGLLVEKAFNIKQKVKQKN